MTTFQYLFTPLQIGNVTVDNRIVVMPHTTLLSTDHLIGDRHVAYYEERAKGGAGLVFTEMTCVSPEGRISPGCTGMYAVEHEQAWKRIVDFIHTETNAKVALQLGHECVQPGLPCGNSENLALGQPGERVVEHVKVLVKEHGHAGGACADQAARLKRLVA